MISPIQPNKRKIIYFVLLIIFIPLLIIASYLAIQIKTVKIITSPPIQPTPTLIPTSTDTPESIPAIVNTKQLESIPGNFTTFYNDKLNLKTETFTGGERYVLSGGSGLIVFTVGDKWFVTGPSNIITDNSKIDLAGGVTGYVFGEKDKNYTINFVNKNKYYSLECVFNNTEAAIIDCGLFTTNLKFIN